MKDAKREVTWDEFISVIGPLNVVLEVREPYPYMTIFKLKYDGDVVGYEDHDGRCYLFRF